MKRNPVIITYGGVKGGTGKTTLAIHTAVFFAEMGWDVVLLDADHQESATNWLGARYGREITWLPTVHHATATGAVFSPSLKNLAKKHDLVVVDAGGQDSAELRKALVLSDAVITPLRTSAIEAWSFQKMAEMAEQATEIQPDTAYFCVFSIADTHHLSKSTAEGKEFIKENFPNFQIFQSEIKKRTVFERCTGMGLTVAEFGKISKQKDLRAETDLANFFEELCTLLHLKEEQNEQTKSHPRASA